MNYAHNLSDAAVRYLDSHIKSWPTKAKKREMEKLLRYMRRARTGK